MHWANGLRVGGPQRRKGLAHTARAIGGALGSRDIWARDLGWHSWVHGKTGVVDHAFRPSPIRVDSDHRPEFIRMIECWRFWQTCVRDEQQREQHATDIEKIARKGHLLLHTPAPSAVPKTFPQYRLSSKGSFFAGIRCMGLSTLPTLLVASDAAAQIVGMERRHERRTGRHERREERRNDRPREDDGVA